MPTGPLTPSHRHLGAALDELRAAAAYASTDELLSVLPMCEGVTRRLDQITVAAVSTLDRSGTFAERGYSSAACALGDLLGWERFEARRRITGAEQVCPRTGLDGTPRPARLGATAEVFAAGQTSLRHVEAVARVLGTATAQRLAPAVWDGAETQLAAKAPEYTPTELQTWGTALIDALDQDGAEPDDRPPAQVNELHLTRHRSGTGGRIKGRFDDAAIFDAIATVIDAHARPRTADEERTPAQRQAEALADVCGHVLDHGDVPQCGGRRPHLNVIVRLDDLEKRGRAAMLDFGGTLTPESLRMQACDAGRHPDRHERQGPTPRHRPRHPHHPRRPTPRRRRPRPRLRPPRLRTPRIVGWGFFCNMCLWPPTRPPPAQTPPTCPVVPGRHHPGVDVQRRR